MSNLAKIFSDYTNASERLVIALHSGTSTDGVDAALVNMSGSGESARAMLQEYHHVEYEPRISEKLRDLAVLRTSTAEKICQAGFIIGELFAEAAHGVARQGGVSMKEIAAIGSSGQIIYHVRKNQDPDELWIGDDVVQSGLDLGEGQVIAQRTGVPTVSNMRNGDIAAGGEGNPLVAYGDWVMFRVPDFNRAVLNIGGIANPTVLPAHGSLDNVLAFDTGPGNIAIDAAVRLGTGGKEHFDQDGLRAAAGTASEAVVKELMKHEYIRRKPPKTAGREGFGTRFLDKAMELAREHHVEGNDLIATLTRLTAESIAYNFREFVIPLISLDEVLVCGGGAYNVTLMSMLKDLLSPIEVYLLSERTNISPEAREVTAVGVITNETMLGSPSNIPNATGARARAIMGQISIPFQRT